MFMGEYLHALDDKGRLTIPARFREQLGPRFVLTRGLDRCLFAYPMEEWKTLEQRLKSLPLMKADARAFARFFFSGATECEPDRQGRILIPAPLCEYASLKRECAVIGVSNRVEIWSRESWESYYRQSEESFDQIAENLVDLSL